jgi:hypothetical protein
MGKSLMKGLKLSAVCFAAACLLPTAVKAQVSSADSAYLDDLFRFLASQDSVTHSLATQAMAPEDSVWAAQMFCQTFDSGVSPADAYSLYTNAALTQGEAMSAEFSEEIAYSVGLYGGAVMNLGAAHYCPQYQQQVQQALSSL